MICDILKLKVRENGGWVWRGLGLAMGIGWVIGVGKGGGDIFSDM